jgi:hypothetical protein
MAEQDEALSVRETASGDVSTKIAALENELAATARRASDLESSLAEAREATVRANEAAREAVARAEEEAREAVARAGEAAREAVQLPTDGAIAGSTDHDQIAELRAEILQLETRLEQTELRARHAYAEAENAQAELRFARERGDAPNDSPDTGRLRTELAAALERAQAAEQRSSSLHSELLLARKGLDADGAPETDNGSVEPEEEGVSLRTRLNRAVESKRGSSDDDTREWR